MKQIGHVFVTHEYLLERYLLGLLPTSPPFEVSFLLTFFTPASDGISISHENFGMPQSHLICVSVSHFFPFFAAVRFQVAPFKAFTWLADFTKIFKTNTTKVMTTKMMTTHNMTTKINNL